MIYDCLRQISKRNCYSFHSFFLSLSLNYCTLHIFEFITKISNWIYFLMTIEIYLFLQFSMQYAIRRQFLTIKFQLFRWYQTSFDENRNWNTKVICDMLYAIMKWNSTKYCVRASVNLFFCWLLWYSWIRLKTELPTVCLNYLHKYNINSSSRWIASIGGMIMHICHRLYTFSLYIRTRIGFFFDFGKDFQQMPNFSHYSYTGWDAKRKKINKMLMNEIWMWIWSNVWYMGLTY